QDRQTNGQVGPPESCGGKAAPAKGPGDQKQGTVAHSALDSGRQNARRNRRAEQCPLLARNRHAENALFGLSGYAAMPRECMLVTESGNVIQPSFVSACWAFLFLCTCPAQIVFRGGENLEPNIRTQPSAWGRAAALSLFREAPPPIFCTQRS